jgi:hypothetical protein
MNKLIEKLCIELRYVGCGDTSLPNDIQTINHILEVKKISKILNNHTKQTTQLSKRLKQLTKETKWLMEDLYKDCIDYPSTIPYVKLLNGKKRIDIINEQKKKREQELHKAHQYFLNNTAKDLHKIIIKYIIDEKQKRKILKLLEKNRTRHLAIELDKIKNSVSEKEKRIIEDFFWSVF